MIKRIGILTSGGDSPGMNAAIRAVVRAGITAGLEVFGIKDGYLGMHQNRIIRLDRQSVTDIINRGGTILGTARFTAFKKESVQNLKDHNIDAMIIIGGDGSYMGALRLSEMGIPCIGIPGTIDNDIHGTDFTIGYDTALNTIVECMDKLRDTCNSHKRVSIVEIMGRHCGDLATNASIAAGADFVIIPEIPFEKNNLFQQISNSFASGKRHGIVALCENITNAEGLAREIEVSTGIEARATILGHLQRGGTPSAADRILASRLGVFAIELILSNTTNQCIGIENNKLVHYDIADCITNQEHRFDESLSALASKIA